MTRTRCGDPVSERLNEKFPFASALVRAASCIPSARLRRTISSPAPAFPVVPFLTVPVSVSARAELQSISKAGSTSSLAHRLNGFPPKHSVVVCSKPSLARSPLSIRPVLGWVDLPISGDLKSWILSRSSMAQSLKQLNFQYERFRPESPPPPLLERPSGKHNHYPETCRLCTRNSSRGSFRTRLLFVRGDTKAASSLVRASVCPADRKRKTEYSR